jgi:hypothetical protein
MEDNISLTDKYKVKDAELTENTDKYPLIRVSICPNTLSKVPDLGTGGDRTRRFGCTLSLGILPMLDEIDEPVMVNADMPTMLVDGDTLEQVKARVKAEIDMMFLAFEDNVKAQEEAPEEAVIKA